MATVSGWLYGSGLVALDVTGDGHAQGRYPLGTISFMPASHQLVGGKSGAAELPNEFADRGQDCASVIDQRAVEVEQDQIRHIMIVA